MNLRKDESKKPMNIEVVLAEEMNRDFKAGLKEIGAWSQELQDDLFLPFAYVELDLGKKRAKEGSNKYAFVTYAWTAFLHTLMMDRDLIIKELLKDIKPYHYVLIRAAFHLESAMNRRYNVFTRFTQIPKDDYELYIKRLENAA